MSVKVAIMVSTSSHVRENVKLRSDIITRVCRCPAQRWHHHYVCQGVGYSGASKVDAALEHHLDKVY